MEREQEQIIKEALNLGIEMCTRELKRGCHICGATERLIFEHHTGEHICKPCWEDEEVEQDDFSPSESVESSSSSSSSSSTETTNKNKK